MKYVLAEIKDGKIHGMYGGINPKYVDIFNYICSADIHGCSYQFDDLEKAIRIRNQLNKRGYSFEIIIVGSEAE